MGWEARWNAKLEPVEREARRLARAASSIISLRVLCDAMDGIEPAQREAILAQIRPHLRFTPSDADWRWIRKKLGLLEEVGQ